MFGLVTICNFPHNSYLTVLEESVQWYQISKDKQARFVMPNAQQWTSYSNKWPSSVDFTSPTSDNPLFLYAVNYDLANGMTVLFSSVTSNCTNTYLNYVHILSTKIRANLFWSKGLNKTSRFFIQRLCIYFKPYKLLVQKSIVCLLLIISGNSDFSGPITTCARWTGNIAGCTH